jgi:hypothetical protein
MPISSLMIAALAAIISASFAAERIEIGFCSANRRSWRSSSSNRSGRGCRPMTKSAIETKWTLCPSRMNSKSTPLV